MGIQNIGLTRNGVVINADDSGTLIDSSSSLFSDPNSPLFPAWVGSGVRQAVVARDLNGDDVITGGNGDDTFFGGAGNDQLHGNGGRNFLVGDGLGSFDGAANLVRNGSFEQFRTSDASKGGGFYTLAPGGLTGWDDSAGTGRPEPHDVTHGRGPASDASDPPAGGLIDGQAHWLDLDASPGNVTVTQTIAGAVKGGLYVLRFDAFDSSPEAGGDLMQVLVNGSVVATVDPQNSSLLGAGAGREVLITVPEGLGSPASGFTLGFRGVGTGDNIGVGIDNVRLYSLADAAAEAGDGDDLLTGGNQDDTLIGGGGNDKLYANEGNNTAYGGAGDDLITAGNGNDRLWGGSGNDTIHANEGRNRVDGGSGNDYITAGNGDDTIIGGAGNDLIYANGGRNVFQLGGIKGFASDGDDTMSGGNQADRYVLFLDDRDGGKAGWGNDRVTDFRLGDGDRLVASNPTAGAWNSKATIDGAVASDFITGSRSGGDLDLTFNSGVATSTLKLQYFFWNNGGYGSVAEGSIGDGALSTILDAVIEDSGASGSGTSFIGNALDLYGF